MAHAHVIESLSFEIEFSSEADARAQHMRFGDFAATRGAAVIGEVFDEFVGADETVRLDRLEVDLGETAAGWTEAEAEQRLREALRQALRAAIGPKAAAVSPPLHRAGDAAAEFGMVWAHLHNGLLPWSADPASPALFDALVARVLAVRGPELAARLRGSPVQARLIARLMRQWPAAAIAEFARLLALAAPAAPAPLVEMTADAWGRRLLALAKARDPAEAMEAAGTTAARRAAAIVALSDATWPGLINGEPAMVRARLRAAASSLEARSRLAALLGEARQRQMLSLWAAAEEAELLLGILAAPQLWRLGGALSAEALGQLLREGLLDHLLAEGCERLDVSACVESLLAARARAEGLALDRVAQSLAEAWPTTGPLGALRSRLRAALATRLVGEGALGPDSKPSPDGAEPRKGPAAADAGNPADYPRPEAPLWRFEIGANDDLTPTAAEPGRDPFRLEPSGLAAHLRRLGSTAVWRRRLARDLTPARLEDILTLFAERTDAALVAAVVWAAESWRLGAAHPAAALAAKLREWLLDDLLLAPPGSARGARDLVLNLLRRRAAYDDLPVVTVARGLADAWPVEGLAGALRTPLLDILAVAAASPEAAATESQPRIDPAAPRALAAAEETQARVATDRARLDAALDGQNLAGASPLLRRALAVDRAWLAATLERRAADPAFAPALAEQLSFDLLFDLAQPWLSEAQARLVLVAAPPVAGGPATMGAFWAEVLAALWRAPGGAPGTLLRRLLHTPDPTDREARACAVRAAGGYIRDEIGVAFQSPPTEAMPSLAAWRGRLPARPSPATARAIAALLTPPVAGLRQLAGFPEVERRDLVLRLRPVDAAAALGTIDVLTEAARAVSLTEPAETWTTFNWRALLRELFEEGRSFELSGFAVRWFEAWAASVSNVSVTQARRRLALALESARIRAALEDPEGPRSGGSPGAGAAPAPATLPPAVSGRQVGQEPEAGHRAGGSADLLSNAQRAGRPDGQTSDRPAASPSGRGAMTPAMSSRGDRSSAGEAEAGAPKADTSEDREGAGGAALTDPPAPAAGARPDPADLAAALRVPEPARAEASPGDPDQEPVRDSTLYVSNAGLVLAGPYIPMLLSRLELTRDGRFVDDAARERAVHLLQFLVDGETEPAAEARLSLNKLVCGLDFLTPIGRDFQIREPEQAMIESLLRTVIQRWVALGRTSVGGLRETFLQRQGALTQEDEAWRLVVEPRAFDMLLDRIPWGYGTLKLPWMAQVLHVDWR